METIRSEAPTEEERLPYEQPVVESTSGADVARLEGSGAGCGDYSLSTIKGGGGSETDCTST
jgi:hypothetical protein